ncbi:hypothetical protein C7M84_017732 [Penaeus vannamei]|uniref:Uncharacterized protein n=1 Tax=Penaeus vannamei TaxID=6689 RepID=A0A423SJE6_PENVA|nr:hypothetical protein C7M84_017732 [Penaeus vannamei]
MLPSFALPLPDVTLLTLADVLLSSFALPLPDVTLLTLADPLRCFLFLTSLCYSSRPSFALPLLTPSFAVPLPDVTLFTLADPLSLFLFLTSLCYSSRPSFAVPLPDVTLLTLADPLSLFLFLTSRHLLTLADLFRCSSSDVTLFTLADPLRSSLLTSLYYSSRPSFALLFLTSLCFTLADLFRVPLLFYSSRSSFALPLPDQILLSLFLLPDVTLLTLADPAFALPLPDVTLLLATSTALCYSSNPSSSPDLPLPLRHSVTLADPLRSSSYADTLFSLFLSFTWLTLQISLCLLLNSLAYSSRSSFALPLPDVTLLTLADPLSLFLFLTPLSLYVTSRSSSDLPLPSHGPLIFRTFTCLLIARPSFALPLPDVTLYLADLFAFLFLTSL